MKHKTIFECIECGYQSPKYYGKCPKCNNWNSMIEVKESPDETFNTDKETQQLVKLNEIDQLKLKRNLSGLKEFDRVLGGGIVPDSSILIGGEPGVGKSTLLLEISGLLAKNGKKILYYSGEESAAQIKIRADRLKIDSNSISILTIATLEDLKNAVQEVKPDFLIIDSIQTINSKRGSRISGSISSMRFVTSEIIELSKINNITVFIIGHITKDGQIAGPKTLEHMVDAVLYFQGEFKSDLRILRAEKNRFGPVNELGIFQMTSQGLNSVKDPSQIFLQQSKSYNSGTSIFPVMQGFRPILIEIQALVTETPFTGNPRRVSVGFDAYRMSMLISIIEKKLKLPFYKSDVFINITGGMNIKETAGDLAVLSTLISSYKNLVLPEDIIIIGEVGLTGEIRPVNFIEKRIKEALRQGFNKFILPSFQSNLNHLKEISIFPVKDIYDFYNKIKEIKTFKQS